MKNRNKSFFPPLIYNVFKPAKISSYDVVRHFKRHLPNGFGKIGHFGTLDPFASGLLMIGTGGAARLNDLIHEYLPKTYLAVGKLGIETPTGDYTSEISQRDESIYLNREISRLPQKFIEERLREKFLGEYWQAPHKYSAAKFMGKNLHEWAREGVEVKKEPVRRFVHEIRVVKYKFPYLSVEVKVSSGTYVRTLFSDFANDLGTIGSLISLVRKGLGDISMETAIFKKDWPLDRTLEVLKKANRADKVLPFTSFVLDPQQVLAFKNGAFFKRENLKISKGSQLSENYFWMIDEEDSLLGLAETLPTGDIKPKINFHLEELI
jgi:tRNA pseudouridine55 synthase